ncbi:hypothetical protein H5410_004864 [Solanum commersonii]|uniref:Uncharacterized protein n=1 Tax=Solanum commersonii TaxID=4109 RepID=A0A9J6A4U1_SOLCO|nr:hypothetical protein H5410_004864 [Solanum commersonii]
MIISEDIGQQPEIRKSEIPSFYVNKKIIGISTIIQELANNYLNGNVIWSYYARDYPKMDFIITQARRTTYDTSIKRMIYFSRIINQILKANWS